MFFFTLLGIIAFIAMFAMMCAVMAVHFKESFFPWLKRFFTDAKSREKDNDAAV